MSPWYGISIDNPIILIQIMFPVEEFEVPGMVFKFSISDMVCPQSTMVSTGLPCFDLVLFRFISLMLIICQTLGGSEQDFATLTNHNRHVLRLTNKHINSLPRQDEHLAKARWLIDMVCLVELMVPTAGYQLFLTTSPGLLLNILHPT